MGKIKHKQRSLLVSIGTGAKDALPKPAQMSSFAEFVNTYLMSPVVCHLTREDYHGLTDEQRKEAKNTSYFCASTFGGNGRRRVANVTNCRLVVLDVDDATAAQALLEAPLEELLPYNFALWTTLTSTAAAPPMSPFISHILSEGLMEMPPESKVRPLPTRAMVSAELCRGMWRRITMRGGVALPAPT